MPPAHESVYKDLLNPVKDNEKAFAVNISELLQRLIFDLAADSSLSFNSAALILQGSASVYGKKVEYLHSIATQLHDNLLKQKKAEEEQQQAKKETKTKEREKKSDKLIDPFQQIEIKVGKKLSVLKKKIIAKGTPKKTSKASKALDVPIHLLSNDSDEKGEVFYDTREEVVGNKGDFALNRCRLISSGWLLLPTVNPKLVPSLEAVPDFYDDFDCSSEGVEATDENCDFNDVQATPDTGFGSSCPPSSNVAESTPSDETPMMEGDSAAASATDEGIGGTPNEEVPNSPGIENVPTEDIAEEISAPEPVRPVRRYLKTCQLAPEDDPLYGIPIHKDLFKRRKIEKKNCRCFPLKLKRPEEVGPIQPIAEYCARTFFAGEEPTLEKSVLNFDLESFHQNSIFYKRLTSRLNALRERKSKTVDPIEDERIDVEAAVKEADEDDETLHVPFDDNDIVIEHEPIISPLEASPPPEPILGENDEPHLPTPDITQIAQEAHENYKKELQQFVQNSEISQRVREWEKSIKPFLEEVDKRESFDINLYGSRILNSFEDNNRKQTITFRQFCKNKEKWEIHRYFMALLPLANVGNVQLESEFKEDGTEEINVTLLSRKMHHKELEEFGHNDGSHS